MTEFFTTDLDPDTGKQLTLCLFTEVQNSHELMQLVISGNLKCGLLRVPTIMDVFQVTVAANKAALNEKNGKLVTRTVYTEMLYSLSISKNITQSLQTFGSVENDAEILVALIDDPESRESQLENIVQAVKGKQTSLSELKSYSKIDEIKMLYKIDDVELGVSSMIDSIASRISVRDFISMK